MNERELDYSVYTKVMGLVDWETDKTYWEKDAIPHYSTDIAAAWQVVEKFQSSGEYEIVMRFLTTWIVSIFGLGGNLTDVQVQGDTAPLAICLAALRAVGAIAAEDEDYGGHA